MGDRRPKKLTQKFVDAAETDQDVLNIVNSPGTGVPPKKSKTKTSQKAEKHGSPSKQTQQGEYKMQDDREDASIGNSNNTVVRTGLDEGAYSGKKMIVRPETLRELHKRGVGLYARVEQKVRALPKH